MSFLCKYRETKFEPADLLAFCGRSWSSRAIALATCKFSQLFRRQWISHLSIVAEHEGTLKNWESTSMCPLPCDIQGKRVSGVQCHDLVEELAAYPGVVWLLRLRDPLNKLQREKLAKYCLAQIGKPYDWQQAGMAWTPHVVKRWGWITASDSHLFCDEFCNFCLFHLRIRGDFNPSKVSPAWSAWYWADRVVFAQPVRIK